MKHSRTPDHLSAPRPSLNTHTHTLSLCHNWHHDWLMDRLITCRETQKARESKWAQWCQNTSISNMQRSRAISEEFSVWTPTFAVGSQTLVLFILSGLNLSDTLLAFERFNAEKMWIHPTVCGWGGKTLQTESKHDPDMSYHFFLLSRSKLSISE